MMNYGNQLAEQQAYAVKGSISGGMDGAFQESTLQSAIGSLHNGLQELQNAIDLFGSRLGGVLQPEGTAASGSVNEKIRAVDRPHSPAVGELHNLRARIESLTIRVNGLSARCEA
jgi:hypothetical protein